MDLRVETSIFDLFWRLIAENTTHEINIFDLFSRNNVHISVKGFTVTITQK